MDVEYAIRILGISEEDDKAAIKKKYRRLMGQYHPDAVGSNEPELIRKAQELNEAYHLLQKKNSEIKNSGSQKKEWAGEVNEKAFCERNIYLYYSMEHEEKLYYQAARGKYMWEPDEEDFRLFLASIYHLSTELLKRAEESAGIFQSEEEISRIRFDMQTKLVYDLAQQFISPVKILRKIEKPEWTEESGREVYLFQAFLEKQGSDQIFKRLENLKEREILIPRSFQGNKILVENKEGKMLGHLLFKEDYLYFLIIPLLKRKMAQVKIMVGEVTVKNRIRPRRVEVKLDFYFRMEKDKDQYEGGVSNKRIVGLLEEYRRFLLKNI
jgi:hypothetical protein